MSWHKCECCGLKYPTNGYGFNRIERHHYIPGRNRGLKDGEVSDTGITQRILWLCVMCHSYTHNLTDNSFRKKFSKERSEFIYRREK